MKCKINFWIDISIYLLMGFLLFSGFLMKFTMPPGTGGQLTILGLDRHGWGEIHFWTALALLIGVALHLYLHWCWIRVTSKQYWPRAAMPALVVLLIIAAVAIVLPHVLEPAQVRGGGERHGNGFGAALVEGGEYSSEAVQPGAEELSGDPCAGCSSGCGEETTGEDAAPGDENEIAGADEGDGQGRRGGPGGDGAGGRRNQGNGGG